MVHSLGLGYCGQLGLEDCTNRLARVRVGTEEAFGESRVLMATCDNAHTLVVTVKGTLFSFDLGRDSILSQNNEVDRLVPTQVEAQHFGNAKVVSAAGGATHLPAVTVTEHGSLHTWVKGTCVEEDKESPMGLGHGKLSPAPVTPTEYARLALPRLTADACLCLRNGHAFPAGQRCTDGHASRKRQQEQVMEAARQGASCC